MGKIAVDNSDYVIFTSDNPRKEEPEAILNDITANLINDNFEVIVERQDAIYKGVKMLDENDILMILGKVMKIIKKQKMVKDILAIKKKCLSVLMGVIVNESSTSRY